MGICKHHGTVHLHHPKRFLFQQEKHQFRGHTMAIHGHGPQFCVETALTKGSLRLRGLRYTNPLCGPTPVRQTCQSACSLHDTSSHGDRWQPGVKANVCITIRDDKERDS